MMKESLLFLKDLLEPSRAKIISIWLQWRDTVPWTYVVIDLSGEEVVGTFYGNELQKTNQEEFRTENFIKRNGDKLDAK